MRTVITAADNRKIETEVRRFRSTKASKGRTRI